MTKTPKLSVHEKNLIRRYLIWCYKTTKEELDRVDRYFTQAKVDRVVLGALRKTKGYKSSDGAKAYKDMVDRFKIYMDKKEKNVLRKKFTDARQSALNPDYQYTRDRFAAIEQAICHFLGPGELNKICGLYEQEMTRRILEAREHT